MIFVNTIYIYVYTKYYQFTLWKKCIIAKLFGYAHCVIKIKIFNITLIYISITLKYC